MTLVSSPAGQCCTSERPSLRYHVCLAARVRTLILVICAVAIAGAAISGRTLLGPIMSGAILMPFYPAAPSIEHNLPSDYEPVHRGYVDGGTGVYYRKDDDLVLAATPPFVLQRTYRSGDPISRHFGVGATHNGERYLRGDPEDLRWAELILEDSMRIRFERTSPGRGVANAMFEHRERTTEYFGSRLGWVGMYWGMWLRDGTIMIFRPCSPKSEASCSLTRMRDFDNHWTHFRRDGRGILREIAAGDATITFEYDDTDRITRARASTGRFVTYQYDKDGGLTRVTTSEDVIRSYTYARSGEMLTIDEPGWFIRNTYRDGRVVRQDTELRDEDGSVRRLTFTWEYAIRGDRVWMTEVARPDGSRSRYEFNPAGYHVAEALRDARGRSARIVIERDPASHGVEHLKLTCFGGNARTSEHQLANRSLRDTTTELLQSCWEPTRK